jgi:hypothetical protein
MALTEAEFLRYENLRSRFLEEIKIVGFPDTELLEVQVATTNFVQKMVAARSQPLPVITPVVVAPTVDPNAQVF